SDLIRIYGYHDFHYITCSCYRRQPQGRLALEQLSYKYVQRAEPVNWPFTMRRVPPQHFGQLEYSHSSKTAMSGAPGSPPSTGEKQDRQRTTAGAEDPFC